MRALLVALFVAFAWAQSHDEIIKIVNSGNGNTWTAGPTMFYTWTPEEFKMMLGIHEKLSEGANAAPLNVAGVPDSYDFREAHSDCDQHVRDQGDCGSCWAFALAEVMTDRYCQKCGQKQVMSPQDLVSCDYYDDGCDGGNLNSEWSWVKKNGIASDACLPYQSGSGAVPSCPTTCADGSKIARKQIQNYAHIPVSQMQTEIMTNGPVEVAFNVYQDFMSYKSGVYHHVTGGYMGGHAVKCIGWGVDNGQAYWIMQNSWNTNWGEKGYFRIRRGNDECGIEDNTWAGVPTC